MEKLLLDQNRQTQATSGRVGDKFKMADFIIYTL